MKNGDELRLTVSQQLSTRGRKSSPVEERTAFGDGDGLSSTVEGGAVYSEGRKVSSVRQRQYESSAQ